MSCQLREVSRINSDIFASLQKFFLDDKRPAPPHSSSNQEGTDEPPSKTFLTSTDDAFLSETESDDGDNAAEEDSGLKNWSLESSDAEPTVDENCKWLKNCLISSTPNMDLVVLGAVQKFVILEESLKLSNRLDVAAWVTITGPHFNSLTDYISSVYTFCIASTRTAEPSLVDWTCICIGLSNGYVHFYTERGVLIFVEQCSQSAIKAIKLGSSIYPGNQELAILTAESKLIVIEGLSLFTTLKTARNQMARMERTVEEISSLLQLNCHCLELDRLRRVHEFQMLGLIKPGSFDQYITAARSALGKYAKVTRTSLPTYNNYFCCTSNYSTFGSFLWHDAEISGSAVISDAIYNFTSQITNSMPSFGIRSWLGVGTSRKDRAVKTSAIDSRSRRVPLRSSLEDKERIGERCYVAPAGWPLVAIADSCARVLLVHVRL
ncbi:rab3 GTPase-activating protein non-catalytic subunit [Ditylenchus destructor]|nr:rab3 GTPase-activating protein non-catalytic subunit [Ditylenchus destructor]